MKYTITIPEIRIATFTIIAPNGSTKREVLKILEGFNHDNPLGRQLDFNNGEVWKQVKHGELIPVS